MAVLVFDVSDGGKANVYEERPFFDGFGKNPLEVLALRRLDGLFLDDRRDAGGKACESPSMRMSLRM